MQYITDMPPARKKIVSSSLTALRPACGLYCTPAMAMFFLNKKVAQQGGIMKFELIPTAVLEQIKGDLQEMRQLLRETVEDRKGLLDIEGACAFLHCSRRTLQHYRDQKLLSYHQRGKMVWFTISDLLTFVEDHRIKKG